MTHHVELEYEVGEDTEVHEVTYVAKETEETLALREAMAGQVQMVKAFETYRGGRGR